MNLYYLAQKRDPHVVVGAGATLAVRRIGADVWRGFELAPGPRPQLRVRTALKWHPFRQRSETIGWQATAKKDRAILNVGFSAPDADETAVGAVELRPQAAMSPVPMPWSVTPEGLSEELDLTIHVPSRSAGPVFLGVHKALDRQQVLDLCRGRGVEIGPGPKPQILPRPGTEVAYIEQMPPEEWRRLYAADAKIDVDERLWEHYRVGEASDLGVEDESLDFIFSSHVFEHLANPLGHLEIWARKLRPGGRIVAVIPDYVGSKDYACAPSPLEMLIAEYDAGSLEPSRDHYARFAAARGIADGGAKMFRDRRSIHVHFYTHWNMAQLMDEAVRRFGLRSYSIVHTPNHKDFYVVAVR